MVNVTSMRAVGLCGLSLAGAVLAYQHEALHIAGHHSHASLAADVGPSGGTLIAPAAHGGYVLLDDRSPVEPLGTLRYHGGSIL